MDCKCCITLIGLIITSAAYGQTAVKTPVVSAKDRTITLKSEADLSKYSEITAVSKDAYNAATKELTFEVHEVKGRCWRLVHDGKRVVMLDYHDGVTSSMHEIVTRATLAECEAAIDSLKLEIEDMQLEAARYEANKTNTTGDTGSIEPTSVKEK